jgi:hypothetical protein
MITLDSAGSQAMSSFGTRYYGRGTDAFVEYGSGVTIQAPDPANHTVTEHEFELSRVEVQHGWGSNVPLLQTGLFRSGPAIELDSCGKAINQYQYYYEYNLTGNANGFNCHLWGQATPYEVDWYAVYSYPNDGSGQWAWGILQPSGTLVALGNQPIGGTTATPAVGEELNNNVGTQCQASSSTTGGFYAHPFGSLADDWYVYFATNGGNIQPITNPNNTDRFAPTNSALWSVPNVPWDDTRITHQGDTDCDTNTGDG